MAFVSTSDLRMELPPCRNHSRGQLDRQRCLLRKKQQRKDRIMKIRKRGLKPSICKNVYVVLRRACSVQVQYYSYAVMVTAIEQTSCTYDG